MIEAFDMPSEDEITEHVYSATGWGNEVNRSTPRMAWKTEIRKEDKLVADPETGALKADGNKLRYDLIPAGPLKEVVKILTYGSIKYADRNWEQGMKWSRPFGAAMRHLWAWWGGETLDEDTGCSHVAHAAVNLLFLLEFENTKKEFDDRPKH